MKGTIEARAKDLALYMIEHRSTVRSAAKAFGVSKSTVHKDLQERLPAINPSLYRQNGIFVAALPPGINTGEDNRNKGTPVRQGCPCPCFFFFLDV